MNELAGRLLVDGALRPGRIRFDARIREVIPDDTLAGELPLIAPGLVDLHVHGFGGADPVGDLQGMARSLARAGTTAFQPTLFPDDPERLGRTAEAVWGSDPGAGGAHVVGLHLEGPFVNPAAAGALPRERLAAPSVEALRAILGPATGDGRGVRTVTLAPELAGARELVRELERAGIVPSLGHSRATLAETRAAVGAAACGATHLFNAMSGFHHREPGLTGFALTDGVRHAEIIGDLAHVDGAAIELALRALGPLDLCLVSDALPGAGTGCDVFHWRGRDHRVHDGAAYLEDDGEEALAGSATGQLEAVRRLVERGVTTVEEALTMAAEAPARALSLEDDLGRLVEGARADFLVLSNGLALDEVWLAGERLRLREDPADR